MFFHDQFHLNVSKNRKKEKKNYNAAKIKNLQILLGLLADCEKKIPTELLQKNAADKSPIKF